MDVDVCFVWLLCLIGESGSGKTESTNFLLHHLTALSQKGSHGCGVEQTILNAGPVLEVITTTTTTMSAISFRFLPYQSTANVF